MKMTRRAIPEAERLPGWNYSFKELPKGDQRIVGLWHDQPDGRNFIAIIYRTKDVLRSRVHPELRYLTRSDGPPHYVQDPDAFVLLPPTERK